MVLTFAELEGLSLSVVLFVKPLDAAVAVDDPLVLVDDQLVLVEVPLMLQMVQTRVYLVDGWELQQILGCC